MTISEAAREALKHFTTKTRREETIVTKTDDAPEWVEDMVRDAHGDMLPDDWRYRAIVEVLSALEEEEIEDADDVDEYGICGPLLDVLTHDLTEWLHSSPPRLAYVDDALDMGSDTAFGLLQSAQLREYLEVLQSVVRSLRDYVEARDEE